MNALKGWSDKQLQVELNRRKKAKKKQARLLTREDVKYVLQTAANLNLDDILKAHSGQDLVDLLLKKLGYKD